MIESTIVTVILWHDCKLGRIVLYKPFYTQHLLWEHHRRLELAQGNLEEIPKPMKFKAAVEAFIEKKSLPKVKKSWSKSTQTIHKTSLAHLLPEFGKLYLSEITPERITKYQQMRLKERAPGRKADTTPRTVNIECSLLRMVLKERNLWQRIVERVDILDEDTEKGKKLSTDEVKQLLAACAANPSRSLYPGVLLAIHTGLRNMELRNLKWKQVDLDSSKPKLKVGASKTKAGKGRAVPLSQTALEVLRDWRIHFPNATPDHFVFPSERYGLIGTKHTFGGRVAPYHVDPSKPIGSWRSAWTTAKKVANVSCRFHDLRHTFVSALIEGGASHPTVVALAGWEKRSGLLMIANYAHSDDEAGRNAIGAAFDSIPTIQ
jgi:integrase